MEKIVKKFSDGLGLKFGKGNSDEWCVYYVQPDGTTTAPKNESYFLDLKNLSYRYNPDRIYSDFVKVYDLTKKEVDGRVFDEISRIAEGYNRNRRDPLEVEKLFSVLSMSMTAEENMKDTMLGKRVKRMGVYALLKEGSTHFRAAHFMEDMRWYEIDELCRERGF